VHGALALLTLAAAHAGDLGASLRASARPSLCAGPAIIAAKAAKPGSDAVASSWDTLRERALQELCVELARAQVRLSTDPLAVLSRARELSKQWPGRAEPWVLRARAHVRLAEYADAWQAFAAARERGEDLRAAHVARDYAVAARMTGETALALASYRHLVPLAALWPEPVLAQRLFLEAAAVALTQGQDGVGEAIGYLATVRPRATSTGLRTFALALDALAAYRRGQPASGLERAAAPEVWHFVEQVKSNVYFHSWPVIPRHEIQAATSLLVERYSASEAAELWSPYVDALAQKGAEASQLARAKERLELLTRATRSP
jgi:hypothetical protein